MKLIFDNPAWWNLLWVVGVLAIMVAVGVSWRRRALGRFTGSIFASLLAPQVSLGKLRLKAVLWTLAMISLVFAIVDIRWGRQWVEVQQKGVDVMFLLDVSKSMLAEDVKPSRLQQAEEYIRDMMSVMDGDRVGLIAFAGGEKLLVPMTSNYTEITMALEEASPHSVTRGGTNLGDAIRAAARGFLDKLPDNKAIVIFTDGEDHESYPVEAATVAYKEKGIRTYIVAMGDTKSGGRIPVQYTREGKVYMTYEGKEVWSKMDLALLEKVALAGGGALIPVETSQADMAEVYRQYIDPMEDRQFEQARINTYIPRFQWFLAPAIVLLIIESMMLGRKKVNPKAAARVLTLLLGAAVVFGGTGSAAADVPPDKAVKQANEALEQGKVDEALRIYDNVNTINGIDELDRMRLTYNQGVAQYRKGQLEKAKEALNIASENGSAPLEAKARFNLGNCYYVQAVDEAKKQQFDPAIKQLKQAIEEYCKSLELNPADVDGRANVELAQRLIDELEKKKQQQQKQQQQNKDQQKQDQNKQQNKDNQQQQQNQNQQQNKDQQNQDKNKQDENKQNKDQQDKNKQDKQEQDKQNKENEQKKKDQQNKQDQNKQDQDKNKKQDQKKDQQQQPESGDKKKDEQKKQEQPQPKQEQNKEKQQPQQQPQPQQKQDKNQQQQPAGGASQQQAKPAEPKKLSKEEAARLLQNVRDKNYQRRNEELQKMRLMQAPVDKDW